MGIDVNDIKIVVISGFQYLRKTCHQWVKDHPLVSGVLFFFYILYIFLPSIFSVLFYTFPFVICSAILLGGSHIRHPKKIEKEEKNEDKIKDKDGIEGFSTSEKPILLENKNNKEQLPLPLPLPLPLSRLDSGCGSLDLESDDEEPQEERNKAVEWTEDDERNLMDLGSSEIERNKRLEKLMEKRKAKKLLSMQPRRSNYHDYLLNYYPRDHHIDRVGPLMLVRPRASRNPFDLPYDPLEERPILRGGSFEEELFTDILKDLPISSRHDGVNFFSQLKEDHASKPPLCFIPKPVPPAKLSFTDLHDSGKESGYSSSSSMSSMSVSSRTSRKSLSQSSRKSRRNGRKSGSSRSSVAGRSKSNCPTGKGKTGASSSNAEAVSHSHSYSLASDMQVEVSEGGSPSRAALDPSPPTDQESLVYDADEDRDVNSGDEDFWGTSPHPLRSKSKLAEFSEPVTSVAQQNEQEVVDQKSTHAEITECRRTSVGSSSSDSLSSQLQGKAQHLAEYLAGLDPLEIESNIKIEDLGTPHVRGETAEEITIQEDSNRALNMDVDKEELKETQRNGEVSKGSSLASNECIEEDLAPCTADQNEHSRAEENEPKSVTEINPRKEISDSFSTTSPEDIGNRPRSGEEHEAKSENEKKTISEKQIDAKAESPNIIHEESTSSEKATAEPIPIIHDSNESGDDRNHTNKDSKANLHKIEGGSQLETRELEKNMELRISTDDVMGK